MALSHSKSDVGEEIREGNSASHLGLYHTLKASICAACTSPGLYGHRCLKAA